MIAKNASMSADDAQTAEIRRLLDRAQEGDTSVLVQIQAILDDNPHVWQIAGNLAHRVEIMVIELVAGKDVLTLESIKRQLKELQTELAGPSPTALEKLLADRIGLEWLFLHFADVATLKKSLGDDFIPLTADFKERKRDLAHRRFLRSIKVLADVRRLLHPKAAPLDFSRLTEAGRPAGQSLPWPGPRHRLAKPATAV